MKLRRALPFAFLCLASPYLVGAPPRHRYAILLGGLGDSHGELGAVTVYSSPSSTPSRW